MFLNEKYNNDSLIEYARLQSREVVISVLGAEIFALAGACNPAILIKYDVKKILKKSVKIRIVADSAMIFNVMIKQGPNYRKKLMIQINKIIESYNDKVLMKASG